MNYPGNMQPALVVLAPGGSPQQTGTVPIGGTNPQLSGTAPFLDPYKVAMEEPIRWAAYINAYFPHNDAQVMAAFGCCEKTARLWRKADRSPRSHHRTLAERMHDEGLRKFMHGGRVANDRYYPE